MAGQLRIVFKLPGRDEKFYFRRMAEVREGGRFVAKPEVSDRIADGVRFSPEAAVMFRDRLREQGNTVLIEDACGNGPLFEPEASQPSVGEDARPAYFVTPTDYEGVEPVVGFIVRPARRPEGLCWCIRPTDIPSMNECLDFETVYGPDPIATVERAQATWGSRMVPFEHPLADQRATTEAKRIVQEHQHTINPGRRRPGDSR